MVSLCKFASTIVYHIIGKNISDIQGEGDVLFAVSGNTASGYRKLDSIE